MRAKLWSYQKDDKRSSNRMENIRLIKVHFLYRRNWVLFHIKKTKIMFLPIQELSCITWPEVDYNGAAYNTYIENGFGGYQLWWWITLSINSRWPHINQILIKRMLPWYPHVVFKRRRAVYHGRKALKQESPNQSTNPISSNSISTFFLSF